MYIFARLIGRNGQEPSLPSTLRELSLMKNDRDYLLIGDVGDYSTPENASRIRELSREIRSFAAQNGYSVKMVIQTHKPVEPYSNF